MAGPGEMWREHQCSMLPEAVSVYIVTAVILCGG